MPLKENKPYLGICLGAQMLAHHLGARVYKHADGHAEVGYYPIRPTEAGREVVDPWPEQVYQWHREGFDLPNGAELMAEGDSFPVQAFRYGTGYCVPVPPRRDARHDVPLDHARPRAHGDAERQAAARAFRRPRGLRSGRAGLAQRVPQSLAGQGRASVAEAAAE